MIQSISIGSETASQPRMNSTPEAFKRAEAYWISSIPLFMGERRLVLAAFNPNGNLRNLRHLKGLSLMAFAIESIFGSAGKIRGRQSLNHHIELHSRLGVHALP